MKINRNLLPMKVHYFLFNGGTGLVIPYLPVLAKELGFSSKVVGTVYTCLPILAMVAKPTMGALADRLHWQKGMFISFIILTMLSLITIPWIPPLPSDTDVNLHCDGVSVVGMCSNSLGNKSCYPDIVKNIGNSSIECNMVCTANSSFIESVCDTWKQHQYCATLRSPNHPLLSLAKTDPSISTPVPPKVRYAATKEPQKLIFSARLLPQHTEQVQNCLFVRLGQVNFTAGQMIVPYCRTFQAATCEMHCNNEVITSLTKNPQINDHKAVRLYQFWMFAFALFFGWVSMAVVVSISDAICFELLGEFPSKYGYQRLWGSIGWGLLSFIGGFVIDQFSKGQIAKNHTPVFILMVVTLVLNVVVAWRLKYKQVKTSASILRDVGRLLSEGRVIIFLLWCISIGMCTAMVWNFLFWYLEELAVDCSTMSRMKTLEGLVMIIQCIGGELPFFFLSGWVLKKIGHIHSMSLVLLSFGVRFFLYSMLANPWWVLPIELLNGVTFGMAYASMASYASIVAPPGTEATTQGLVGAVFEGLGTSFGSFLGGFLMDSFKGAQVFRMFSIGAFICCIIHAVGQYYFSKKTAVLSIHEKDFKHTQYASPNDAIHMLEDSLQEFNAQPR